MNVTLKQLRAFVAVARTGSFTLAAGSLFVTQSALSALIKELETSLGLRLIDRSTRQLSLSEVGSELYPLVEKILHDLDAVLGEASNLKALKKGVVRVAVPQLMASALLPDVIAAYGKEHPAISIRLVDCTVESVVSRVFTGEVDFGVGPERELNADMEEEVLFEHPFMAVMPPAHPLARMKKIRWDELVAWPLITLQGQFTEMLSMDLHASVRGVALNPRTQVAFMSTALSMVAAGLGVTVGMKYSAPLVALHGLEMRPLVDPVVLRRFYVFTRRGRSLSPTAESFRGFLFDYMARTDGA